MLLAAGLLAGCAFYFKTYRTEGPVPFTQGMSESSVLSQWGSPLSVQILGPAQVWRYFAEEPTYGNRKKYYLVWFQNGHVFKWEKTEEEVLPPSPET